MLMVLPVTDFAGALGTTGTADLAATKGLLPFATAEGVVRVPWAGAGAACAGGIASQSIVDLVAGVRMPGKISDSPLAFPAATALCIGVFPAAVLAAVGTGALVGVGGNLPTVGGALALSGEALLGCAAAPFGFNVGAGDRRGVGEFLRATEGCLGSREGIACMLQKAGSVYSKPKQS